MWLHSKVVMWSLSCVIWHPPLSHLPKPPSEQTIPQNHYKSTTGFVPFIMSDWEAVTNERHPVMNNDYISKWIYLLPVSSWLSLLYCYWCSIFVSTMFYIFNFCMFVSWMAVLSVPYLEQRTPRRRVSGQCQIACWLSWSQLGLTSWIHLHPLK